MAVYTKVTEQAFKSFAAEFGLSPPFELTPIPAGIENTNYRATTDREQYVLTLLEGRSLGTNLEVLADTLEHFFERGLPVPRPLRTAEGRPTRSLCNRSATLVTWLPGTAASHPDIKQCGAAGQMLAQLHLAGPRFPNLTDNSLGSAKWRPYFEAFSPQLEPAYAEVRQLVTSELDDFEVNWPSGLPSGFVHADYFPDNVLFEGGAISGVLDFYYSCRDFLAYDLAIALTAWSGDDGSWPDRALFGGFLEGYESLRPLEEAERLAMRVLLRGACLRFLLTRLHDWIATPEDVGTARDPERFTGRQYHSGLPANYQRQINREQFAFPVDYRVHALGYADRQPPYADRQLNSETENEVARQAEGQIHDDG